MEEITGKKLINKRLKKKNIKTFSVSLGWLAQTTLDSHNKLLNYS